jgi:hypothetical protein
VPTKGRTAFGVGSDATTTWLCATDIDLASREFWTADRTAPAELTVSAEQKINAVAAMNAIARRFMVELQD